MKKLIRNGLLFSISCLLMYTLLFGLFFAIRPGGIRLVYRTTQGLIQKGGGTYVKFREFNPEEKYDIVILGSSHAYKGYDPRVFNSFHYRTFNLGTSSQNMVSTYFLAKQYLHHDNCKIVILDMYDRIYGRQSLESFSDLIMNVNEDNVALQLAIASNDLRSINMLTFRMFSKLSPPENKDTVGFINGFRPAQTQLVVPALKRRPFTYEKNEAQLRYLDKLLTYLDSQKIQVIVAEHPLPVCYQPLEHEKFRSDILPVFERHHLTFHDYTNRKEMTGINFFADDTHLNEKGAEVYNRLLIGDLIKCGELKPLQGPDEKSVISFNQTNSTNVYE